MSLRRALSSSPSSSFNVITRGGSEGGMMLRMRMMVNRSQGGLVWRCIAIAASIRSDGNSNIASVGTEGGSPHHQHQQQRRIHRWRAIQDCPRTTMDQGHELSWELVEQAAAEKIARHRRANKQKVVLAGTEKLSGRKQRFSVVFEGIPRRRNLSFVGIRPERIHFCDRIITDDVINERECRMMIAACESAVRSGSFIVQGPEVSFVPLEPATEDLIGSFAYRTILSALQRIRMEVMHDYHLSDLYFAGAMFSRLGPIGGSDDAAVPNNAYWNPHIDKANKKSYDFSAVLYLNSQSGVTAATATSSNSAASSPPTSPLASGSNSQPASGGILAASGAVAAGGVAGGTRGFNTATAGATKHAAAAVLEGFQGGSFTFLDADADRLVTPIPGRMLAFTSGFENPHVVEKVKAGERYALSAWFTTDPQASYKSQVA